MKSLPTKILLGTAALVALTLVVAPKVIGAGVARTTIDNLLALISPEAESQLEIRRNEISTGWFRSSASIEIIFTPIGTDVIALVMDFDIDHGPLLQTQNGLGIGLAYANIKPGIRNDLFDIAVAETSFPLPDILADLLVRFDQSIQLNMNVREINYSGAQGEMNFEGMDASVHVASDQSASFAVKMGELSVTESAANFNVIVAGVAISITSQMNDILVDSSAILSIPSLSSTAPVPFSISDLVVDYGLNGSPIDPESSEIYQTLSIANIDGGVPVRSFSWRSEIKQLKNELLREYYRRLLSELQSEFNADPEVISEELLALGQELFLIVLQNKLELNNLIAANAFDGDHTADLRIAWAGLESLNDAAQIDMNEAMAALDITLAMSLDLEAILRSPLSGLIDPYVQQGYLTVSNGRVMINASLQNSVLVVNGDQLPLDQFL